MSLEVRRRKPMIFMESEKKKAIMSLEVRRKKKPMLFIDFRSNPLCL
jgi:hypothetical protein